MNSKVSILIGLDAFADPAISAAPFAEAHVSALALALEAIGYSVDKRILLIGASATKTMIESRLRQLARKLGPADEVMFAYSGIGFSEAGKGYFACRDTVLDDLSATALALADVCYLLRTAGSRLTLFLDAGAAATAHSCPELVSCGLSISELQEWFAEEAASVCFTSCQPGERTYASSALKHRVWGHHLIEVFSGAVPSVLQDGVLTAAALHSYLKREMPRTLRKVLSEPARQTPCVYGKNVASQVVADLTPVLALRRAASVDDLQQLRRVSFRAETRGKVKELGGYQKGHRIPDQVTPAAQKFVARIAADDVRADVESTFNALREQMGYKRKDLEAAAEHDGQGFVRTPAFDYTVGVGLDSNDPTAVVWKREVSHILDPAVIREQTFQAVFGTTFDTLIFEFAVPLDVAEFVDRIEDDPIPGVRVRSSIDASSCEITLEGFAGSIRVHADRLTIAGRSATAASLVDQFFEFQRRFGHKVDLPALRA